MSYTKLPLDQFGKLLVETGDLDPIYIAFVRTEMPIEQQRRWLLAYWCSYHAGFSSYVSERSGDLFWGTMIQWAHNTNEAPTGGRWPRGRERRHFRGNAAVEAVDYLFQRYPQPEWAAEQLEDTKEPHANFTLVNQTVRSWPMFGPWIAFKVVDMLERCRGVKIQIPDDVIFYEQPREAAKQWLETTTDACPHYNRHLSAEIAAACFLDERLGAMKAPPNNDRKLWLQEYETILCKWKSHQQGTYPIGIDTHELRHALNSWIPLSVTAKRMSDVADKIGQ